MQTVRRAYCNLRLGGSQILSLLRFLQWRVHSISFAGAAGCIPRARTLKCLANSLATPHFTGPNARATSAARNAAAHTQMMRGDAAAPVVSLTSPMKLPIEVATRSISGGVVASLSSTLAAGSKCFGSNWYSSRSIDESRENAACMKNAACARSSAGHLWHRKQEQRRA